MIYIYFFIIIIIGRPGKEHCRAVSTKVECPLGMEGQLFLFFSFCLPARDPDPVSSPGTQTPSPRLGNRLRLLAWDTGSVSSPWIQTPYSCHKRVCVCVCVCVRACVRACTHTHTHSFRTSVGVRQGCLLSPVMFNLCLENIMQEALHNCNGTVLINGREISNPFSDDIDLIVGTEEELQELTTTLEIACLQNGNKCRNEQDHGQQQNSAKNYYINVCGTPRRSNIIQVPRVDHLLWGRLQNGDKDMTL